MSDTPLVTHNEAAGQFEAKTDAGLAVLTYAIANGAIDLKHTGVPPNSEMRGVGSALVRYALDFARANGLKVIPTCPFVRAFLVRHPEYQDLRATP